MKENSEDEQALFKSSWREIRLDGYLYKTKWRMESGRLTSNASLKEIIVNDRQYFL
jgi:hypothetical protein